jgi:hypothetical protein
MKLNRKLTDWIINNHNNLFLSGIVSFGFPGIFLKSFYEFNKNKQHFWDKKKACLSISFDCDYAKDAEAIPYVLKMLSGYSFKTSFACVGHWIEQYPDEHALILERGHEIMNHTYSHPDNEILNPGMKFKYISRDEKKTEIEKCHQVCKKILKYEPIGGRIPHFKNLFTAEIYGILRELGYRYSSSTWTMNTKTFGMPFKAEEGILEFPLSTCPRHPFTVFDTWHSLNSPKLFYKMGHRTEEEYIALAQELIDLGIENNSYINIYIDPYDVVKMKRFAQLLNYIKSRENELLVANYQDIASKITE